MKNKAFAVIDLSFGDSGKGLVTDYLAAQYTNSLVIRYCGGQQAGHRVQLEDVTSHIFSNFGSGTFRGAPTYWSKFCTFCPVSMLNEYEVLEKLGVTPTLYLDKKALVTTPFDVICNIEKNNENKHGTCGVGVGTTIQREEEHLSLLVEDLYDPIIFQIKLNMIAQYYYSKYDFFYQHEIVEWLEKFIEAVEFIKTLSSIIPVHDLNDLRCNIRPELDTCIFEGSQGLLLDQNYGFFPHVTRANTGLTNPLSMGYLPEVYLVTRAYQTRHGNGPMTNENLPKPSNNIHEHNSNHKYQGEFRSSILDINLLKYAINKAEIFLPNTTLVITCLDVLKDYSFTLDGRIVNFQQNKKSFIGAIKKHLNIDKCLISESPISDNIKEG